MNNEEKNTYVKSKILESTISLLSKKKISEISISEVVEDAMVARASFYRNFQSIEDVLYKEENRLVAEFNKKYKTNEHQNIKIFFYELAKHLKEHQQFYEVLYKSNLTHIVQETIQEKMKKHIYPKNNIERFGLSFFSYGIYGWILSWIQNGMKDNPEDLLKMMELYENKPFKINQSKTD